MQKRIKESKKLKLNRETISNLQTSDLVRIAGAWSNTSACGPISECGPSQCACNPE